MNRLFELIKLREIETGEPLEIKALADATGVSRQAIYKWLKGDADIYHRRAINAFCKYFNCQIGDLLIYVPDKPGEPNGEKQPA